MLNSSKDVQQYSEAIDNEFLNLQRQALGNPNDTMKQELDKFRQQRDVLNLNRTDEEKLAEKFFQEIKFRGENEKRAKREITEAQKIVDELDKFIMNAKEIETKSEVKSLLEERLKTI